MSSTWSEKYTVELFFRVDFPVSGEGDKIKKRLLMTEIVFKRRGKIFALAVINGERVNFMFAVLFLFRAEVTERL